MGWYGLSMCSPWSPWVVSITQEGHWSREEAWAMFQVGACFPACRKPSMCLGFSFKRVALLCTSLVTPRTLPAHVHLLSPWVHAVTRNSYLRGTGKSWHLRTQSASGVLLHSDPVSPSPSSASGLLLSLCVTSTGVLAGQLGHTLIASLQNDWLDLLRVIYRWQSWKAGGG